MTPRSKEDALNHENCMFLPTLKIVIVAYEWFHKKMVLQPPLQDLNAMHIEHELVQTKKCFLNWWLDFDLVQIKISCTGTVNGSCSHFSDVDFITKNCINMPVEQDTVAVCSQAISSHLFEHTWHRLRYYLNGKKVNKTELEHWRLPSLKKIKQQLLLVYFD